MLYGNGLARVIRGGDLFNFGKQLLFAAGSDFILANLSAQDLFIHEFSSILHHASVVVTAVQELHRRWLVAIVWTSSSWRGGSTAFDFLHNAV